MSKNLKKKKYFKYSYVLTLILLLFSCSKEEYNLHIPSELQGKKFNILGTKLEMKTLGGAELTQPLDGNVSVEFEDNNILITYDNLFSSTDYLAGVDESENKRLKRAHVQTLDSLKSIRDIISKEGEVNFWGHFFSIGEDADDKVFSRGGNTKVVQYGVSLINPSTSYPGFLEEKSVSFHILFLYNLEMEDELSMFIYHYYDAPGRYFPHKISEVRSSSDNNYIIQID